MKKLLLTFLLLFIGSMQAHVQGEELPVSCNSALQDFISARQEQALLSYDAMVKIFSQLPNSYKKQRKLIRTDINNCRQYIRKYAKNSLEYQQLLEALLDLYDYVKLYKEYGKAIQFHMQIEHEYCLAFNNSDIVKSIEANPTLHGVAHYRYKCRAYFNKISKDLRTLNRFEDTLHANYGVLKAHNYAYKIELIKIRNCIYHHNIYKFETRYF